MSEKKVVSVVVPAYNEEKEIGRCLDALLNQSLPKEQYEIIVIDNRSTDKTAEIARERGVKVISFTEGKGYANTKQFGTKQSSSPFIAYMDADSQPSPKWLETALLMLDDTSVQVVGGSVIGNTKNPVILSLFHLYDLFAQINQLLGISMLWGGNMILRRSAFEAVGGFNTSIHTSEDWDICRRIREKFGSGSTLYTSHLTVKTSPRKQKNIPVFLEYVFQGTFDYISIFIFHSSVTYGRAKAVR